MKAKLIFFIPVLWIFTTRGFWPGQEAPSPARTADAYVVDTLATGLTVPWDIVFLPDKTMLFTERSGKVGLLRNNRLSAKPVLVVGDADVRGKMGLLGMCLHPQFNKNGFLYLSYNYQQNSEVLLKIVRYRFASDTLLDPVVILDNIKASRNHTGCRLKFGPDGKLYITTGDADRPILAQDLRSLNGKILRVSDDGSIPADNPFVGNDTARKEIWTYGHRNPQGIDFEPRSGRLFNSEHGPTGGDEINLIDKNHNYGWPLVHHKDVREGMTPPLLEYTPSIGPSEIVFYTATAFPGLKGKLLVACLRGEKIMQLQVDGTKIVSEENLFQNTFGRIRALAVGPDGYLYFSTSQNDPPEGKPGPGYDMILRLRPSSVKSVARNIPIVRKEGTAKEVTGKKTPVLLYQQLCASCHGKNLEGTKTGQSLRDGLWNYGGKRSQVVRNISEGIIEKGMPAWLGALTQKQIEGLADFILAKSKGSRNK